MKKSIPGQKKTVQFMLRLWRFRFLLSRQSEPRISKTNLPSAYSSMPKQSSTSGRLMCRTCRDSVPGRSVHCRIHDSGDDGASFRIRIHGGQTAWHGTSDLLHLARCCRLLIVDDVPLNLSVPKALLKKVGVNDVGTAVLMLDEKRTASSAPESESAPEAKDSGG